MGDLQATIDAALQRYAIYQLVVMPVSRRIACYTPTRRFKICATAYSSLPSAVLRVNLSDRA